MAVALVAGLMAVVALGQTWTVDDDGPADFPSLQAAIDAAAPGDVLLVHPGWYGDVSATKELSVLAAAGTGFSTGGFTVTGAPSFQLSGAGVLKWLAIGGASGHVVVDGCSVGGGFGSVGGCIPSDIPYVGDAAFSDCALLEVNRSHFRGGNGAYPYQGAKPAVRIGNCTAAFVDCEFLGGDAEVCGAGQPIDGQPAAVVEGTSAVVFAGCTFIGGDGNPTGLALGNGGAGVRVDDVASADVRGSSVQVIAGGTSLSKFPPTSFQVPAVELLALGSATVSGVRVSPWPLPTSVTQPAPALPWIRFTGSVAPGGTAALEAFGPVGTSAIGALALQAALGSLPGLAPEPFWLAPAAIIAVFAPTLLGPEVPAPTSWVLPADPALAGVAVDAQVFAPQGHLTNPAVLVLRW